MRETQEMATSTLKIGTVAFALTGAVALATPSWASGATSAVKKVGGPSVQTDVLHINRMVHRARHHDVGATSTEFSSANRTGARNVKWK